MVWSGDNDQVLALPLWRVAFSGPLTAVEADALPCDAVCVGDVLPLVTSNTHANGLLDTLGMDDVTCG